MRKVYICVALISACLLVACGKIDPISQKVMDDINQIGEVTLGDGELINNTMALYVTLTDDQKNQVKNYTTLVEANEKYKEIVEADELAKKAEVEAYFNEEPYKQAIILMSYLKGKLLKPSSFSLSYVKAYENDKHDSYSFDIGYSGENRMGGMTENYAIGIIMKNNTNDYVLLAPGDDYYSSNHLAMTTAGNSNFSNLEFVEDMDITRILEGMEYMGY